MALSTFQWWAGSRWARAYAGKPARSTWARLGPRRSGGAGASWQAMAQGRCLDLRELAGLGELQQLERALDLGQALLAHMQINRSGREARMAQQPLHDGD